MNIKYNFKLDNAAVALLSLLLCGTMMTVSGLSPADVNLGTASEFVILTKTGVTTTGVTAVTGDVGVSPIASTAITGFDLVLHSSTTYSTSSLVTGKVYAASYTAPTPTKMTTAISDMETAFVDAAGRSSPDYIELHTGDLSGAGLDFNAVNNTGKPPLNTALYKWSTTVEFTDDVYFNGTSTDIFILQIAQDLTVGTGAKVILTGGALPENIFWQVSGQTSIGAGADVQGIILCKNAIVFGSGSTLNGRALAQTAVTMIATTIV